MDEKLILIMGKDPLFGASRGDSFYVRAWGRAAIEAGFSSQVVCVGRETGEEDTEFGRLHRVRSPLSLLRDPRGAGFRSHTIPFHRGIVVRKVIELARRANGRECIVHGFGPWNTAAVTAARRLRREGIPCRCVTTFYTSVAHEYGAKARAVSQGKHRLSTRLKQSWETLMQLGFLDRYEREAYLESELVLVNYDSVRQILEDQWGPREGVRKVPYTCANAFSEFGTAGGGGKPADLPSLPEGDAPLLLSVSVHDPRKGVDVFIRALAILKKRAVAFRACVASEGALRKTHRELVDALSLSDQVVLPGYVPDVQACLEAADVFVLPSLQEASGSISMLEAMQAGRAIVASDVDGIPEDITHRESGLLVPAGDAEALADALEEVIRDAELRRKLGSKARKVFEDRFSAETVVAAVRELYGRIGGSDLSREAAGRSAPNLPPKEAGQRNSLERA